jgi:hypothetical protein
VNIDKLECGEELDRLIAEKVMGWESFTMGYWGTTQRDHYPYHENERQTELEAWLEKVDLQEIGHFFIDVENDFHVGVGAWKPSANISDAWQVVEKLVNTGHCPALLYNDNEHWTLSLDGLQNLPLDEGEEFDLYTTFFVEKGMWLDSVPLAICIAALKAVENEN